MDTSENDVFRSYFINSDAPAVESNQASRELREEQRLEAAQAEKDKDMQDMGMDMAVAAMEEAQERRLERINGDTFQYGDHQFDLDSLKDAVNENMENWDEFSKNMTAEEKAEYLELSVLLMDTNDPEEVERILNRMDEVAGEETEQTLERADNYTERTNTVENKTELSASTEEVSFADDFFGELPEESNTPVAEVQSSEPITQTVNPTPVVVGPAPGIG